MKTLKLLLFFVTAATYGQTVSGRYVVELAGDAAAVPAARRGSRLAAREADFGARRAAVRLGQTAAREAVEAHGGTVVASLDTVLNALIVNIADERAGELAQLPGVTRVHAVRRVRPTLDHALPLHQVPAAWSMLPLGQSGAGAGIKIGMIDTGIDVNHPAFGGALPPVAGFPLVLAMSDTAYTNSKIIVAKNYTTLLPEGGDADADDHDGHGTGTAMAAAGGSATSPYGPIVGVAPAAYLGSYKVLGPSGATLDVIAKAIDDAVADGMDVINLSLGAPVTSYSDVSLSDLGIEALEAAAQAGVVVTVSAGNGGPGAGSIADLASAPDVIAAGAISNDRALGYAVQVAGASPYEAVPGTGPAPAQALTAAAVDAAAVDASGLVCSPLAAGSVAGMVVLIQRGSCTFESKVGNAAAGGAAAAIVYDNQPNELIIMDVGASTLPAVFIAQADGQDLKSRIANGPVQVTLDFSGITAFAERTDLAPFSSRGPSIGTAMKPDLVAVGEELVTAAQHTYPDGESYGASGFIITQGTSFSAPLTAGAAAVVKGARPGLTSAQYRSLVVNNSGPATAGPGLAATVQQAGAGVLNVAAALGGTIAAYPTSLNFGTGAGTISQSLNLTLSNLGSVADTLTISVAPTGSGPSPTATTTSLAMNANDTRQVLLNTTATGLAAGEYQGLVQVTSQASGNTIAIPYWFAVPGSTPAGISVLYSDISDAASSTAPGAVLFRVVDLVGLPISPAATPSVVVSAGGGSARVYRTGSIPGTYAVDLRTGTSTMQLQITVGAVTQSVVIPVG